MVDNRNQLAGADKEDILKKLSKEQIINKNNAFGDGNAATKILESIDKYI